MRKLGFLSLVGCFILGMVLAVDAQEADAIRGLVDKAIKAQGGAKNLAKSLTLYAKAKGTLDFMNGTKFTTESWFQDPDKFKNSVDLEINNMNITVIQVFDGKKFWLRVLGETKDLTDDGTLKEIRENMYAERLTNLIGLKDKGIELSALGEVQVNKKDAVGIRASSKGHRDVNLYFDKQSRLLVKSEYRTVDLETKKEVNQEKFFSEYKDVDGVKTPHNVIIHRDGKQYISLEITAVTYVARHEDGVFAKP